MDSASPVILHISVPEYKKIIIEASDGKLYHADLASFKNVYCFPKDETEWGKVYPDSFGTALIWQSRFEVHIDQIIGLAYLVEVKKTSV